MTTPVRLRRLGGAVVLGLALLAGCSGEDAGEPSASATATTPSETPGPSATETSDEPTQSTEPTESAEPSDEQTTTAVEEPEPTDEPTSPPHGLRAALLTAGTLPAPGGLTWRQTSTRRGTGGDGVSVCQVVDLTSLGATRAVTRSFRSGSVSATQVVAKFPDEIASSGGFDILEAWLSRCAKQAATMGFDEVRAPEAYTFINAGDAAGWALVTYGPVPDAPNSAHIETQALVRAGDTLSWVVWEETGQDYNYQPGQAPPELAVPMMAAALT